MKSEGAIRQKVKQVVFRHLKSEVESSQSRRPSNCKHNFEEPVHGSVLRLCSLKESEFVVCDESRLGLSVASKCSHFCPRKTPEDVKSEFKTFLRDSSLAEKARRFPDIVALSWVLGIESEDTVKMIEIESTGVVSLRLDAPTSDSWSYYKVMLP